MRSRTSRQLFGTHAAAFLLLAGACDGPEPKSTGLDSSDSIDTGSTALLDDTDCLEESPVPEEWPETSEGADASFARGDFLAGVGDVNGDGLDDIMIEGQTTYVGFGPICGFDDSGWVDAALENEGGPGENRSASDGGGAGDVNGDGYADVIVGDDQADDCGWDCGEAYLVLGPFEGTLELMNESDADWVGAGDDSRLGHSVAALGDVDGDGTGEVILGAPGNYRIEAAAWIVPAEPVGRVMVDEVGASVGASSAYPDVGEKVAGLGDGDGDGLDDALIGCELALEPQLPGVAVFRGPIAGQLALDDADAIVAGLLEEDRLGWDFCGIGDQDGDGLPELAATAKASCTTYLFDGAISGNVDIDQARTALRSPCENLVRVAAAGDVDGDGQDDLMVGNSQVDIGADDNGAVYIVAGPLEEGTFELEDIAIRIHGVGVNSTFGTRMAGAGDTNGDGYDDLLIGHWEDNPVGDHFAAGLFLGRGF